MTQLTQEEMLARLQALQDNRIELGNYELAIRHDDVTGRYSRVLYLAEDEQLRVEMDLTAKSSVLCEHPWNEVWKHSVKPGMLRVGEGRLDQFDTQYRWVRTASPVYQRIEESMLEFMSMKEVSFLTNRNFLKEINWVDFFAMASQEPDGRLACLWQHCRKPVADLRATISRQLTDTNPYRQGRLGQRARWG